MRPLLLLFLFALTAARPAACADLTAADYLALRGSAGGTAGGTEFNAFRRQTPASAAQAPTSAQYSRVPGYLAWKNTCVTVARMAAGGSFEFATGGGFAAVAPYVLLSKPVAPGWLELLAAEFSPPADKRAGRFR